MTQPHHMSRPTEDRMARFDALLDELSSERDVVKASDRITSRSEPAHPLLPLDSARRFACDVEHDTIDLIHLVGDSGTDLFQDLVREPAPVGGHRILAGHRA